MLSFKLSVHLKKMGRKRVEHMHDNEPGPLSFEKGREAQINNVDVKC